MNTALDFYKASLGFDRMIDALNSSFSQSSASSYPPYNIQKVGDRYTVEVAVAGFAPNELSVEVKDGYLEISGSKRQSVEKKLDGYQYKGISDRSFSRKFLLSEHEWEIESFLENGILSVVLKEKVPEHKNRSNVPIKVLAGHSPPPSTTSDKEPM